MNPNANINADILVGTFQINGYDLRKIWYNTREKLYIVTNKDGTYPRELVDNTFTDKQFIINTYKSLHYSIVIDGSDNLMRPMMTF